MQRALRCIQKSVSAICERYAKSTGAEEPVLVPNTIRAKSHTARALTRTRDLPIQVITRSCDRVESSVP
ncbi:uncharacterized protein LAESUDRAFT_727785 [Laetiporus sulphureus 93-53]|uniref:Uncharacterized protein n=1 Tax=Laetiporus sulphureus 93-53 TaxID=1314785 RepID=A0A165DD88_9APHY|nr:uncharacterized protein LAESUDRAFT_727785 [Laetiporus sulphureus 93-53]KZT04615.1 hypothetical protein LAESUDRAFT_727785 [Laetiporus sulphureus 93-53]